MQLKPFSNPFARRMLDKKPVAPQLVFIDEDSSDLVDEPEDIVQTSPNTRPIDIPSFAALEKYRAKPLNELSNEDGGAAMADIQSSPGSKDTPAKKTGVDVKVAPAMEERPPAEVIKRVKLDIPIKENAKTVDDGTLISRQKIPPRIRRSSTTIFSHSTTSRPISPPDGNSRRLFSLPGIIDEPRSPSTASQRTSSPAPRPGPALPPKPHFRPLQRRATTPAEAQPSRQNAAARSNSCVTLPSLDIVQNVYSRGQIYRDSELLLGIFNTMRDSWPDRPYAVMNHLRQSLLISLSVFDDPSPLFASDHGGEAAVKQVVCRYRRNRNIKGKSKSKGGDCVPVDLCLVLWQPTFMSFREQCFLQETQRYRARHTSRSTEWPGAQRVMWYPSWEPTRNLPDGMAEQFSLEKETVEQEGRELTFEMAIADGDWC
ncbi:hypothetical protein DRE_01216 [Drechslerella stenobrocha 248]|uniref:Uncharacterized protein n=1 Tax=Drechslerella stenobrocha 248 TaxID=1043628 RepID=W7I6H3_9PEZI|nr:hypothetical protein DRE_01216 [Drechslerella stenobrocha 248]